MKPLILAALAAALAVVWRPRRRARVSDERLAAVDTYVDAAFGRGRR